MPLTFSSCFPSFTAQILRRPTILQYHYSKNKISPPSTDCKQPRNVSKHTVSEAVSYIYDASIDTIDCFHEPLTFLAVYT